MSHLLQQTLYAFTLYITEYWKDWIDLNGESFPLNHTTINVPSFDPHSLGEPILTGPSEQALKDTIIVYSRQITVIRVSFAPQDGSAFSFD